MTKPRKWRWDYASERVVPIPEKLSENPNAPSYSEEKIVEAQERLPNHLLHELNLKENGGVVQISKEADVWYPHIYRCLRNERLISITALEQLGAVLGLELVWRKKKRNRLP